MKDILKREIQFRYMMLDRMRQDCAYYLGNGNRLTKYLWAGDEVKHIACMKSLWNSFPEGEKPEWLTYEQILEYEKEMCPKAILVERDYKGEYERFALTPEEFAAEFPETYKDFGPIDESNTDTLKPFVHIWFEPCVVGDAAWQQHFSDMEWGLPASDVEAGNVASVREDMMQSLKKYVFPPTAVLGTETPSLNNQIKAAEAQELANAPGTNLNREHRDVVR